MTFKTIISGHLEFGSPRSYEKVMTILEHRIENYYKNDVLIKPEEVFFPDSATMDIPRLIGQASDKCFRNTLSMLDMIMQYAVAGSISIWKLDNGVCLDHHQLEPRSDKVAVQSFLRGRELIRQGKQSEARKALSKAIDKFERHALAYERRGHVNFLLGNLEDALYDFNKSIHINPHSAEAHMGRAAIYLQLENVEQSIQDFEQAAKSSIPHQPIYWKARRGKGESHLELKDYAKAEFEFKLLTKRTFTENDPNFAFRKKDWINYGRALLGLKKYDEAIQAFDKALTIGTEIEMVSEADSLLYRGIAMQKAGKEGYRHDWERAAKKGSQKAVRLLQES